MGGRRAPLEPFEPLGSASGQAVQGGENDIHLDLSRKPLRHNQVITSPLYLGLQRTPGFVIDLPRSRPSSNLTACA